MINLDKKIDLAQTILSLSIDISTNSIIDVFVDFASHTREISVRVIYKGWNKQHEPDYRKTIYLNYENSEEELQEIIDFLKLLKEEN